MRAQPSKSAAYQAKPINENVEKPKETKRKKLAKLIQKYHRKIWVIRKIQRPSQSQRNSENQKSTL